jgi:NADPH:quinone reductase-like Zn-dependent oxidoreductase
MIRCSCLNIMSSNKAAKRENDMHAGIQEGKTKMRVIVRQEYGGPDQLVIQELAIPQPRPSHVVIQVKAFGLNHAETYMRKGQWGNVAKVSGIECVGIVEADQDGRFAQGAKVAALMGGMGRTVDGSYAEYTCVPATNVVPIQSELSWEELAAIPESYATAWARLHGNLALAGGQTLVIRGATSALGQAAMVRRGGRVCLAGFLGGLEPIPSFNPLLQMPSGVHFSFFGSFMFGMPEFPLSDVPLQTIIDRATAGAYQAKPAAVFRFDEIREAHRLMEANRADGKLVVRV